MSDTTLRLTKPDGSWIESPALMFLAATTSARFEDIEDAYQAMASMPLRTDRMGRDLPLSASQKQIHDRVILGQKLARVHAGTIPVHIAKIHKKTGAIPSINTAFLTRADLLAQRKPTARKENTFDTVRNAFSSKGYRSIAHYLATHVCRPNLLGETDDVESIIQTAFSMSLGWQNYLSEVFKANRASWSPIRVPGLFEPVHPFEYIDEIVLEGEVASN